MRKRFLFILLVGILSLALSGCEKIETIKTIIQANLDTNVQNSDEASEKTPSGETMPDGTLKDSRLTELEKPFVGFWESEDGHMLVIREAAIASDGYTIDFPLDAIIFFPYVEKSEEYTNTWDLIRRGDENISLVEEDGKLIFRDTQYCPNSNDPNDTSHHRSTEQLEYDSSTDTITYKTLYNEEPSYWQGAEEFINYVVFYKTDRDIEEADWDTYYSDQSWRDPR